jgi:hypothetical protein
MLRGSPPKVVGPAYLRLMSDSITATAEYNELFDSIKRTIAAGRLRAARAVNNVLVETYWAAACCPIALGPRHGHP